jgi:predicted transcriptional regulator
MDLRTARSLLGWTQQHLGKKSGVSQRIISAIERQQEQGLKVNTDYKNVICLTRALRKAGLSGVTLDDLFPISDAECVKQDK